MASTHERLAGVLDGAAGAAVVLSENPIHDTGGGQRSAQIARDLLRRGWAVLFVSRGEVTETVDLELDLRHPRLVEAALDEAVGWLSGDPPPSSGVARGRAAAGGGPSPLAAFLSHESALLLTQVAVEPWLRVIAAARAAGAPTVYECIDPWSHELGGGWYRSDVEAAVARASDVLVATAPALRDQLERMTGREAHLVPNAFDRARFAGSAGPPRPDDLPEGERIALFVGALWGGWFDWKLVRDVVRLCPDTCFVFVGDRRREGRGLGDKAHFLGLKPHAEIPAYLAHADVAFLPWRVLPMTESMSPVTVYEHIGAGLPVVAPSIETVRGIPGVVEANGAEAFAEAVRATNRTALSADLLARMESFRARSSWSERVDRLLELVDAGRGGTRESAAGGARPPAEDHPSSGGAPASGRRASTSGARRAEPRAVQARPSVSVVVPSYEHEAFLPAALDSIAAQTLPPGETVVVDDGSTDGSASLLVARADPGLRLYVQDNRGAHAAINRAIALSGGDYIAILNSDDVFSPERVEHAWSVAQATGAALLFGSVQMIDDDGRPLGPTHHAAEWYAQVQAEVTSARSVLDVLQRHNLAVTTSNFFLHRALWEQLEGFRPYRYVHDYDFLLRALDVCPDRVVHEPALRDVRYRLHGSNTIAENVDAAHRERAEMLASRGRSWLARLSPDTRRRRRVVTAALEPVGSYRGMPRVLRNETAAARGASAVDAESGAPAAVAARPGRRAGELRVGVAVAHLDAGGLEEVVGLLASALPRAGVEVSVLCTNSGGAVAERLAAEGLDVCVAGGDEQAWTRWLRRVGPDVVSSHHLPIAAMDALAARVPVVETVHNVYAWYSEDDWVQEARKRALATSVVAVSDLVARYYDRHTSAAGSGEGSVGGRDQIAVVPNAVHPGRSASAPRDFARRHFALPDDAPVFVHLGRAAEQKNLHGLLHGFGAALERSPSAVLVLASPSRDGTAFGRLRRAYAELFAARAVRVFPPVRAVGALLTAADAYVANSFYEGWSVAASEAVWVGTPVVLSECGGASELVGQGGARGLLVPNPLGDPLSASPERVRNPPPEDVAENRRALTGALAHMARERDAWAARRGEIREDARDLLAPHRMVDAYLRVLADAGARGSGARSRAGS